MMRAGYPSSAPPTPNPTMSPNSPPGMTTSKSSKSSSFQSNTSDDASTLGDQGHFEDIGLDDDGATLKSPQPGHSHRMPSPGAPPGRSLASSKRGPTPRSSYPNLRSTLASSNPRSTSLTVLTDPTRPVSPGRRSSSNSSTTSLPVSGRRRSPSPGMASNPRGPSIPARPRPGGRQLSHRKSFAELEHECDEDEGDDIPEGLVLDNVPISPRPPHERPPSRQPSVSPSRDRSSREPKERVRSVGNGTPPVAQAQGSLKSPTWKSDVMASRPGLHPVKSRAHSWNSALADLSAEAKALTEKLEEHADEEEEQRSRRPSASGRPNTWNSMQRSSDYSYDKKERVKSTPELPPLRRTNVMIDPLPVSKEKEAVLSRTRPSWLPPKDPAEEKKHLRQYQKMMAASAKADERREAARRSKTELKDTTADGSMQTWENDIIPRWNDAIRERKTRELWWRGVPPRSRGLVWMQALGNELGLNEGSFDAALERAQELEARVKEDKGDAEDVRKAKWFENIRRDVSHSTWKDLRIFDLEGPLHHGLVDVLMAYAMYRSDIGYVSGCNTIAALLLLNLPSPAASFISLANVLNRPLPLSFYTLDAGAQASAYNLVLDILARKSAPLHQHLTKGIENLYPGDYLEPFFTGLFTGHLAIEEASRLWDVYVFEGDALLVRAAVALLLGKEMSLLGTKGLDDVRNVLSRPDSRSGDDKTSTNAEVGAEEKFITAVREAGKA